MTAVLYLLLYLAAGVMIVRCLVPRAAPHTRVWLGLSLGLLLLMWLPALCAFALKFTLDAHLYALIPLALLCGGAFAGRSRVPAARMTGEDVRFLKCAAWIVIPLTVYSGWLQYTHCLRPDANGGLYVGQSTYGDLQMHLSFITSLREASFPPEYAILPGNRLAYPFLVDSLSTSLYMMDFSLQLSVILPGTLMTGLCYFGYCVLAREMTHSRKAMALAALLFFLNGGLGFLYTFDLSGGEVGARLQTVMTGYYQTPTNQPEPNNLRWSNVIADMLIPQRTTMAGWTMLLPCLYLMYTGIPRAKDTRTQRTDWRRVALLGVWAGAMPMVHTHSFLALGLATAGFMSYDLIFSRGARIKRLLPYALYGALAAALALPQLITWTFKQAGSSQHFLQLWFNWVNNPNQAGLIDNYLWFYVKNVGLPVLVLICALVEKNPAHRRQAAGAFCIFIVAELVRFQPNAYDNNKLFYVWYMLCCPIVADYCVTLWKRLWGLRGRWVMAAVMAVCFFLSAGLTLAREAVSSYQAYDADDVAAAAYVEEHTPLHAKFMTGMEHLNPVASLAGRTIVCGPDLWLHYHGFDTTAQKAVVTAFYADPKNNLDTLYAEQIEYIYVSSYEYANLVVDEQALRELFPVVFEQADITIYQVPEKYREQAEG